MENEKKIVSIEKLQIQLIPQKYHAYAQQPESYLFELICKQSPWPNRKQSEILSFLQDISKLYLPVSYHNLTHAFDVMVNLDCYLIEYGWMQKMKIDHRSRVLMLIAAYAHDSGHQGLSNSYYKNSGHELGKNSSPLEYMHVANLKSLLRKHSLAITPQEDKQITEIILKTDNFFHGWLVDKLKQLRNLPNQELNNKDNKLAISCVLMHAADLNNVAKDISISIKWTERLYQQFKKQTQLEIQKGLPVSYPLVKNESEYASSNIGFLDHLVLPLFQGITEISPNFSSLCERVAQNRAYWAKKTIKEAQQGS